ncbi:MAG: lipoprotein-releasing ABC transporter permease subunit [Gammaproteobacteria bacterium]|nr:lipoprotein-releasing ABC transporter permease subunit [Gammaproteobacteria bacterium]
MNSLSLQLAKRYYKASYQNRYIRFINRASSIGIALGVLALIVGLSVMNGFEKELKSTLLSVVPDVEFEAVQGKLAHWPTPQNKLAKQSDVKAAAPYIKTHGMIQKQNLLEAVLIHGADPLLEQGVNATPEFIVNGSWFEVNDGAVIGQGLADKLKLKVGDKLQLLLPKVLDNGKLGAPTFITESIIGIYQLGGQMDYGQVYIPLSKIQQTWGWQESEAEGIKVALYEPFEARYIARQLGQQLDDYVYVLDWFRTNGHIYNDIVMVRDIMYLVMVLVMAVACFNIVSSLTMAVQEKHGDIGILKTMGLQAKQIRRVFVIMGMMTALRGVVWGVLLGVLLANYLADILLGLEQLLNFKTLDSDVYFINHIPSSVDMTQVILIASTAIIIAFIASYFPANRAAQLQPVELIS